LPCELESASGSSGGGASAEREPGATSARSPFDAEILQPRPQLELEAGDAFLERGPALLGSLRISSSAPFSCFSILPALSALSAAQAVVEHRLRPAVCRPRHRVELAVKAPRASSRRIRHRVLEWLA